jgi:hypothetical protein
MSNKVLIERISDMVHKCCDWKDGEITGFRMDEFEQRLGAILESKLTPHSVDGELEKSLNEILSFVEWVGCESTQEGDERKRIITIIKNLIARREGSAPQEPCNGAIGLTNNKGNVVGIDLEDGEWSDLRGNIWVLKESEPEQPSEQDIEREVNHIFESGANEVRVIELIKRLVSRKGSEPSEQEELIEPIPMKAGDKRVLVNGKPLSVDFRIIAEETYQIISRRESEEQEELWVEAQELFDYEGYGSVSKKFVIYRRGSNA